MNDLEHSEFIQKIINNPDVLKKILENDKALSNMISDMIISDMLKNGKSNDDNA
tara:strand:- start:13775 stop:13936 length:162 start_codon:yes stop_codon:yes gene_type:complete